MLGLEKLKNKKSLFTVIALLVISVAAGSLAWLQFTNQHTPLPDNIKKKLSFQPYSNGQSKAAAAPSQLRYDPTVKNLNYQSAINGVMVEVSQQATPNTFKVDPQAYTQFINGFENTESFDAPAGKVYVTHPKNAGSTQTAILNTGSVLIFVRPAKSLGIDGWKQFFSTLNTAR